MSRRLPLLALALVAGCSTSDRSNVSTPTVLPSEPRPVDQQSSVCSAYVVQLDAALRELAKSPRDAALLERVATFKGIIADACN